MRSTLPHRVTSNGSSDAGALPEGGHDVLPGRDALPLLPLLPQLRVARLARVQHADLRLPVEPCVQDAGAGEREGDRGRGRESERERGGERARESDREREI